MPERLSRSDSPNTDSVSMTRRAFLGHAGVSLVTVSLGAMLLRSDSEGLEAHIGFERWRTMVPEIQPKYAPLIHTALNRLGLVSLNEVRCEHRANSLSVARRACADPDVHSLEVDVRLLGQDKDTVAVAMHDARASWDMDIYMLQDLVDDAEREQRMKLLTFDPKGDQHEATKTYDFITDIVAERNRGSTYVMNFNPFGNLGYSPSDSEIQEKCLVYPGRIQSIGIYGEITTDKQERLVNLGYRLEDGGSALIVPIRARDVGPIEQSNPGVIRTLLKNDVSIRFYYTPAPLSSGRTPGRYKNDIRRAVGDNPFGCIYDLS